MCSRNPLLLGLRLGVPPLESCHSSYFCLFRVFVHLDVTSHFFILFPLLWDLLPASETMMFMFDLVAVGALSTHARVVT